MELPKLPAWVWIAAAGLVVVIALLARKSGGAAGTAPVVVSNPPSDAAIGAASATEQAGIAARQGAFSDLTAAIAGVTSTGVVAGRDVAIAGISTNAQSYQDTLEAQTAQTGQAYGYYGTLANANAGVAVAGIQAATQRAADALTAQTAQYVAGQETQRNADTNRNTVSTTASGPSPSPADVTAATAPVTGVQNFINGILASLGLPPLGAPTTNANGNTPITGADGRVGVRTASGVDVWTNLTPEQIARDNAGSNAQAGYVTTAGKLVLSAFGI